MKFKIFFQSVTFIPCSFIYTHLPSSMNSKTAIREQVWRISKNHINRIFGKFSKNTQAICLVESKIFIFVIWFLHNYFFKRSSTDTPRAFAMLCIVSIVGFGLSSSSILTTVFSDKSASFESLSCESPFSCRSCGKSFPQKIVLPKLRPHFSATCLNTWKAEPRKKNTLSFFKRNFTPTKSKMQGVFFFRGCRGSASQWRNDTFSLKKSSSK